MHAQSFCIFEENPASPVSTRSKSALRSVLTPRASNQNSRTGLGGGPSKTPRKTPSKARTPKKAASRTPAKATLRDTPAKSKQVKPDHRDSKFRHVLASAAATQKSVGAGLSGTSLKLWQQAVEEFKTKHPDATLRSLEGRLRELKAALPQMLQKHEAHQDFIVVYEQEKMKAERRQEQVQAAQAEQEAQAAQERQQEQAPPAPPPQQSAARVAPANETAPPRTKRRASTAKFAFVPVWQSEAGPKEEETVPDPAAEQKEPIMQAASAFPLRKRSSYPSAAQRALVPHSPSDAVVSPVSSAIQGRGYFAARRGSHGTRPR